MTQDPADEALTQYLLGDLDEGGQQAIEQQYFRDERLYDRLLMVEDELLADYARNVLPPDERRKVGARLLASPENRERVAVLEALWAGVDQPPASRRQLPRWLIATAALLIVSLAGWMLADNLRLRGRVRDGEAARAALEDQLRERREGTAATPSAPALPVKPMFALSLTPGMTRTAGAALPTIHVTDSTATIEITLTLPAQLQSPVSFATIRTPDDREAWSTTIEGTASGTVVLHVPASAVPPDDYEVRLQAGRQSSSLAEYYFGTRR